MNGKLTADRAKYLVPLLILGAAAFAVPPWALAQVPVDEYGQPLPALEGETYGDAVTDGTQLGTAELEELVGPVALYPDDLLAIVLPASTYPLEIVQAARFLDDHATDSSLEPDESWDESVVALLNYPEVVYMMDKEIDWTWRLGEAVINQQADVLAAVEAFRDRAYAAGNLKSDERQTVTSDDGYIEIEPVEDDIIYVPYYEPEEVVVYQPYPVYYYYPYAYPVYYYPYPVGYSFASGYFWGVTTAFTIGWHSHYLNVYHPSYWGHPYYGRHYYGHYYRRPSITVFNTWYVQNSYRQSSHRYRDGDHWRPRSRSGARPETQRVRNYHGGPDDRDSHRSGTRSDYSVRQQVRNRDRARSETDNARGTASNAPIQRSTAERARNSRESADTASRQRLTAPNTRENVVDTRARQVRQADRPALRQSPSSINRENRQTARPVVQRQVTQANRQASRQVVQSQAQPASRQPTRAAVQRQSPPARPASTPTVQRQAPAQATRPATQQQAATPARVAAPQRQVRQANGSRQGGQTRTRRNQD